MYIRFGLLFWARRNPNKPDQPGIIIDLILLLVFQPSLYQKNMFLNSPKQTKKLSHSSFPNKLNEEQRNILKEYLHGTYEYQVL